MGNLQTIWKNLIKKWKMGKIDFCIWFEGVKMKNV